MPITKVKQFLRAQLNFVKRPPPNLPALLPERRKFRRLPGSCPFLSVPTIPFVLGCVTCHRVLNVGDTQIVCPGVMASDDDYTR